MPTKEVGWSDTHDTILCEGQAIHDQHGIPNEGGHELWLRSMPYCAGIGWACQQAHFLGTPVIWHHPIQSLSLIRLVGTIAHGESFPRDRGRHGSGLAQAVAQTVINFASKAPLVTGIGSDKPQLADAMARKQSCTLRSWPWASPFAYSWKGSKLQAPGVPMSCWKIDEDHWRSHRQWQSLTYMHIVDICRYHIICSLWGWVGHFSNRAICLKQGSKFHTMGVVAPASISGRWVQFNYVELRIHKAP